MKRGDIVIHNGQTAEVFDIYTKDGKEMLVLEYVEVLESRGAAIETRPGYSNRFKRAGENFCAVQASEVHLFKESRNGNGAIEVRKYR